MSTATQRSDDRLLTVEVASGDVLDVRHFTVEERLSSLFEIRLVALTGDAGLDFDSIIGERARFSIAAPHGERLWTGVVRHVAQAGVEEGGLSTYEIILVPELYAATQRRNHRMFQQITEPDIALGLLGEWGARPVSRLDLPSYKKRKYRVQYGETDHTFLSRVLEEAGVTWFFETAAGESTVVLSDAPQAAAPRAEPLTYVDTVSPGGAPYSYATELRIGQDLRPGRYTVRDRDLRLSPTYALGAGAAAKPGSLEDRLERFHYLPGAMLFGTSKGEPTPVADDKGKTRSDEAEGAALARRRLDAQRAGRRRCTFSTNAHDLAPGMVVRVGGHPHPLLREGSSWLVVASSMEGTSFGEWRHRVEAVSADVPYRPPLVSPRPRTHGPETATVVGPPGEEIHVDEMGRVRVHFHWDRESRMNHDSSAWIPVSQPWSGTAYGGLHLPRVGQEVLVDFLGGDPDRPVVVGRVFTGLQKVPYRLPEHRTRSTWKSQSSPGGEGFNEILFEDLRGQELVYEQAERDRRRLVKNDETLTVGNDRQKLVKGHEIETTHLTRTEVTGAARTEITGALRTTIVGGDRVTLVRGGDAERLEGNHRQYVGGAADLVVGGDHRASVEGSAHLVVQGSQRIQIAGSRSSIVGGDTHEKVSGKVALEAEAEIHLKTPGTLVLEVGQDFTIKGPGGFIRITAEGITMKGNVVKINSGGSPGEGSGANPAAPAAALVAEVTPPTPPVPDDVSRTGLGR